MSICMDRRMSKGTVECQVQVEQQQQVVMRKQEQATAAREALQQLKAAPDPSQQIAHLILQQNQPLYLGRVLQVDTHFQFAWHHGPAYDTTDSLDAVRNGFFGPIGWYDWTRASLVQQDYVPASWHVITSLHNL